MAIMSTQGTPTRLITKMHASGHEIVWGVREAPG
jgi:hypothetical protein